MENNDVTKRKRINQEDDCEGDCLRFNAIGHKAALRHAGFWLIASFPCGKHKAMKNRIKQMNIRAREHPWLNASDREARV
jgi:hypothetical protein